MLESRIEQRGEHYFNYYINISEDNHDWVHLFHYDDRFLTKEQVETEASQRIENLKWKN